MFSSTRVCMQETKSLKDKYKNSNIAGLGYHVNNCLMII